MFSEYKDIVGVEDLCSMLGIGKNTAYKLINSDKIQSWKIGKVHKIPKKNIMEYVINNAQIGA